MEFIGCCSIYYDFSLLKGKRVSNGVIYTELVFKNGSNNKQKQWERHIFLHNKVYYDISFVDSFWELTDWFLVGCGLILLVSSYRLFIISFPTNTDTLDYSCLLSL